VVVSLPIVKLNQYRTPFPNGTVDM
jgi:hypothetical protein